MPSGKGARAKGANAERELVAILREHGYKAERSPLSGALSWLRGDICGTQWHIECKRQETVRLSEWVKQAKEQAEGKPWLLIHRRSRQDWLVTQELGQWLAEREVP